MRAKRPGFSTLRWRVFGIKGCGLDGRWQWLYRDFQPQAWMPSEAQ